MTDNPNRGRGRNARREQLALLAIGVLAALLAVSFLARPSEPLPDEPTPTPTHATVETTSPPASPSASASDSASASPRPGGEGAVGDYGCLTLAEATAAVEGDGFEVGSVAYTLEGGPVTDDWLVSDQTPASGEPRAPGSAIDLVLSNPFMVCPTP
ncbi:MAG TPA: PASTA domain-containing protein [Candidatus Limnocylindrales bacterium]|nr:PASTA domain-containing protein [Candidatus Limnocylindrales bacterium]